MCFDGGDEPKITYTGPTKSDAMNIEVARENRALYNQYFKGLESEYLHDIQDDLGGYAENKVASDVAQATAAAKEGGGPVLANRGQATGLMGTAAQSHGSGLAAGVTEADTMAEMAITDRNMIALQNASGLGANISSNIAQLGTQSTQAALQASDASFRSDLSRYADTSQLMSDVAGAAAYAGANKFKTGHWSGLKEGAAAGWGGSEAGSAMDRWFGKPKKLGPDMS